VTRSHPSRIERGDEVAQLVIQRVERAELVEVTSFDPTERGERGFGTPVV
jgi:dUTPase